MSILTMLAVIWFLFRIYTIYFKRLKTFDHVIKRSLYYSLIGMKKMAESVLKRALNEMNLTDSEKRDVHFLLGLNYTKMKNYPLAIQNFDHAFNNYKADFLYSKDFAIVVQSYIECNEMNKAKEILNFFLSRKEFDKKFKYLERKFEYLLT